MSDLYIIVHNLLSIISGTGLGLLACITIEVVRFCAYAPFPALLPFLKFILEVVLCEGVQHCLRFCLSHLSYIETAVSSIGKTEKSHRRPSQMSRVSGGRQSFCFWSIIPRRKRKCEMRCHDATASTLHLIHGQLHCRLTNIQAVWGGVVVQGE
jgi:hypothetical protein